VQWAKADNLKTRGLHRYTVSDKPGSWQQTAPDFMEALEPYWNQLRPMVLLKPDTFLCPVPAAFDSEKFKAACKERCRLPTFGIVILLPARRLGT
jgi:hypothetical protein